VRELEAERVRLAADIHDLECLRAVAAERITGIITRLEKPE